MNQKKHRSKHRQIRRRYTDESEDEAVQLMQHGHSPPSVMERFGLPSAPLLQPISQRLPHRSTLQTRIRRASTS